MDGGAEMGGGVMEGCCWPSVEPQQFFISLVYHFNLFGFLHFLQAIIPFYSMGYPMSVNSAYIYTL